MYAYLVLVAVKFTTFTEKDDLDKIFEGVKRGSFSLVMRKGGPSVRNSKIEDKLLRSRRPWVTGVEPEG